MSETQAEDQAEAMDHRLGEIALGRGLITSAALEKCRSDQRIAKHEGRPLRLAQLLVQRGLLRTQDLVQILKQAQQQTTNPMSEVTVGRGGDGGGGGVFGSHLHGRTHISRYELVREIARGGMGVVYEAIDPDLKRRVALKVLKDSDSKSDHVTRLNREAHLAARLSHPNIIPIHEVGATQDANDPQPLHFIAMDYVEGETLADAMPRLGLQDRMDILGLICDAVGYAHGQGVIHRDLKPANILLTKDDRPIVTDFGLARDNEDTSNLTVSGAVMGTSHYMAPEQVLGRVKQIGERCDVWALGVIMYEMLCDRRPFEGTTQAEVYHGILRVDPPAPRGEKRADRDLETICLKALEKEALRRYATGRSICEELQRWRDGDPILARPPSTLYRLQKLIKRHPWFISGVILSIVLIALGGWWGMTAIEMSRHFRQLKQQAKADYDKGRWAESLVFCERAMALRDDEQLDAWASTCKNELDANRKRRELLIQRSAAYQLLHDAIQKISRKIEETRPFFNIPNVAIADKLREVEEALVHLDRIARDKKFQKWRFADAWALLGTGYYLVGRMRRAEAALLIAAEPDRHSEDWWVNYYLGRIYLRRALAIQLLDGLLATPILEHHWREKALTYLSRPMSGWSGAKQIDKDVANTFRLLAAGKIKQVSEACEKGQKKYKGTLGVAEYWHLHGYAKQGQARIEKWNTALKQRPHDAWIYYMRGCAHQQLGHQALARKDYDKALQINRYQAYALNNRGVLKLSLRETTAGRDDLRRATRLDDQLVGALTNYGWALKKIGQQTQALNTLERASRLGGSHWQVWWRYGAVAASQPGGQARALGALRKALKIAPVRERTRIESLIRRLDG